MATLLTALHRNEGISVETHLCPRSRRSTPLRTEIVQKELFKRVGSSPRPFIHVVLHSPYGFSIPRPAIRKPKVRFSCFVNVLVFESSSHNKSLLAFPSSMAFQQQNMPTATTAPMYIPTGSRNPVQPMAYLQQPYPAAQSLPMYAHQPQPVGYPSSGYTYGYNYHYGTPASTQYPPGSVGGPYMVLQDEQLSPPRRRRHRHRRSHHHRRRSDHRYETYSDPEYGYDDPYYYRY